MSNSLGGVVDSNTLQLNARNLTSLIEESKRQAAQIHAQAERLNLLQSTISMLLDRLGRVEQLAAVQSSKLRGHGATTT